MKLGKREASVLDWLVDKRLERPKIKEIAAALGLKQPNATGYIKRLESAGLIRRARRGQAKEISLERFVLTGLAEARRSFPFLKPSDVLAGRTPFLLCFAGTRKSFRISELDAPAVTAKRLLKRLRGLGLFFMPSRGVYALREEARPAADFCRQALEAACLAEAEQELRGIQQYRLSFDSVEFVEAVFILDQEAGPKHYWPTAYTAFHQHGVGVVLAGKYYYSSIKPGPADVVIHALAVSRDARSIAYACALMLKNNLDAKRLLAKRQRFGLSKEFLDSLAAFMQSKGGKAFAGFPSWEEVKEAAYGKAIRQSIH